MKEKPGIKAGLCCLPDLATETRAKWARTVTISLKRHLILNDFDKREIPKIWVVEVPELGSVIMQKIA
jgi:hypothetical protein